MAVVSISRIQVRRGQKNAGSGLPQLASGEFGWAVDTQELFIGNGSVSEGAPFVGNTKLLSENDNLFEFANTYQFKSGTNIQTGDAPNSPVLRTLQARLDDRVSIRSFGAAGDGTNQTAALQRAIDQLYLNASNKGQPQARVELILEPGEYLITNTIYLPPFTTIRGAGIDKTIINAGNHVAFRTVNETSTTGVYAADSVSTSLNQARHISISGLTINSANTAFELVSCKESTFKDLKLSGSYDLGSTPAGPNDGIRMISLSTDVGSNNNVFENIKINNFFNGIYSDYDIKDNIWTDCTFNTLYQGLALGLSTNLGSPGMQTGPKNNIIMNSVFDDIETEAIYIKTGQDNKSKNNKFYLVGLDGGATASSTQYSILRFVGPSDPENPGAELNRVARNTSEEDWFQRSEELGYNELYRNDIAYYPEVEGPTITDFNTTHKLRIGEAGEYTPLFRLSAEDTKGYEIDYIYKSDLAGIRSGKLSLVVDPENNRYDIADEYEYTGAKTELGGFIYDNNLKFDAQNLFQGGGLVVDTIAITMLNLTSSDTATLYYRVKTKS